MMSNNNNIDLQRKESLKRRWHDSFYTSLLASDRPTTPSPPLIMPPHQTRLDGVDLVPGVVPSVTVVLEGRSICQRVNLHKHANYHSLAKTLRHMFKDIVDHHDHHDHDDDDDEGLDLSNAVPGYIVAYEDLENDLLLAGDLNWKDFVRVAKRIRIMPVKSNSRKQRSMKQ